MKFGTAKEIGLECGLESPAEWVNNIVLHTMNLFGNEDIAAEMAELEQDAIANGVRFSLVCGDAVLDEDSVEDECYMCRGIRNARD